MEIMTVSLALGMRKSGFSATLLANQYNYVFGLFLSGPGIAGPYANGSENLAIVPGSNPPLPITISSVNSVTPINQQYFVNNQNGTRFASVKTNQV